MSMLLSAAAVLPHEAQEEIERFARGRLTGQVTLNFLGGRVRNTDTRTHVDAAGPFCSVCERPRRRNETGWIVRDKRALCQVCQDGRGNA